MWFEPHLACPDCQRDFTSGSACDCGFGVTSDAPRDFRPQRPKPRVRELGVRFTIDGALPGVNLERPRITYRGPSALRDSRELFSAVQSSMRPGARILDLGCGPRDQAAPAQHYGLEYVGVDFSSSRADLLADAHAIPFRPGTFDAVLSYAVLEHLYDPFLAVADVVRVLKPGGLFFGTVSQGEPFHESFFHHTAFGVLTVFGASGLMVERMWPSYDTLHALSRMGRYPRPQRLLIEAVYRFGEAMPFLAPRKFFRWTDREKQIDELHRAASICFVAVKSGARPESRRTVS